MSLPVAIAVFVSVAVGDVLYAIYASAVADRLAVRAGLASAAFHALAYVSVIAFVQSPVYLVAVVLGAFVGTNIGMRVRRR